MTVAILPSWRSWRYDRTVIVRVFAMALVLGACADPGARALDEAPGQALAMPARAALSGYEAYFVLTWRGARIGGAAERMYAHGRAFERRERVVFRRGDALVHSETDIAITMDKNLVAETISVRHISNDSVVQGRAFRDERGQWRASYGNEPAQVLPGDAVPAELVPLLVAREHQLHGRGRFRGPVILAGYGFAVADLEVRSAGERTCLATLHTRHGVLASRFALTRHGTLARVRGGDGMGAMRVARADLAAGFEPPEIVDASSIPVAMPAGANPRALVIEPAAGAAPPALPGQRVHVRGHTWQVMLDPGHGPAPGPDPTSALGKALAPVAALVQATAAELDDDLGVPVTSARAAMEIGRGDCTAHALVFAKKARARGISVRLVTGYRLDGDRLVRHRWAIVKVAESWVEVDPTHGEAPARPGLLGLAVHDTRAADLAMADELAFAGFAHARARAVPGPAQ